MPTLLVKGYVSGWLFNINASFHNVHNCTLPDDWDITNNSFGIHTVPKCTAVNLSTITSHQNCVTVEQILNPEYEIKPCHGIPDIYTPKLRETNAFSFNISTIRQSPCFSSAFHMYFWYSSRSWTFKNKSRTEFNVELSTYTRAHVTLITRQLLLLNTFSWKLSVLQHCITESSCVCQVWDSIKIWRHQNRLELNTGV